MRNPQHRLIQALALVAMVATAGTARAQPDDDTVRNPWPEDEADPKNPDGEAEPKAAAPATPAPTNPGLPGDDADLDGPDDAAAADGGAVPEPPVPGTFPSPVLVRPDKPFHFPMMFNAATGDMLPAGVILGSFGLDTGGGVSSDTRIGLGDVAEFGVGTTDLIGTRRCDPSCGDLDAVQPYVLALFKMGVSEHRLFHNQPAMSLGFRKSFERSHDARKSRIAELYFVASKGLGPKVRVHVGGVFWDASLKRGEQEVLLHDQGVAKQLRPFGGIELQPMPRSKLLLEVSWVPEFEIGVNDVDDDISLRPMFSWGVRYDMTKWAVLESGVRIPDIGDINLLDAQIFGQIRFVSRRFSRFLEGLN